MSPSDAAAKWQRRVSEASIDYAVGVTYAAKWAAKAYGLADIGTRELWDCRFCKGANFNSKTTCGHCGAPRRLNGG